MSLKIKTTEAIVYECGGCGASGVKLWREYNTFLDQQTLECCDCTATSQNTDVSGIDSEGRIDYKDEILKQFVREWQIGGVPATLRLLKAIARVVVKGLKPLTL